jgi:hypothetical protein
MKLIGDLNMPMRVIDTRKQLPQRKRNRRSMIMDTEEWQEAIKKIESGLKAHEGIELVVSKQAQADVGENVARILKYQLQKYIKERDLDLEVFFRGKDPATDLPITYVTVPDKKSRG